MAGQDSIEKPRLEKLQRIIDRGINPYPHNFLRTHTNAEAAEQFDELAASDSRPEPAQVSLAGRVTAQRFMGKAAFSISAMVPVKCSFFCARTPWAMINMRYCGISTWGISSGSRAFLFKTKSGETKLDVVDYVILAKSMLPLPEKWHGLQDVEKRYRQRYLDLIANEDIKNLFVTRSKIISTIRNFMHARSFIEVETPVLQPMYGGALARPFITHHHALDQDLYPRIALELYLKRLIIGGFDRVFEIGRVFRNEGISTKHNPEFTMMESYEAYADYNDVMRMTEDLVSSVAREVLGTTTVNYAGEEINFAPPWKRLPLRQSLIDKCGIDFMEYPDADSLRSRMEQMGMQVDPLKDRGRLIDELLSTYVEPDLKQPTFLIDYPIEMSPLAKRHRENPALVERFEAFIGTMEVANSFSELNDPREQRERFVQQRDMHAAEVERARAAGELPETEMIDDDFVTAMEHACHLQGSGYRHRPPYHAADRQTVDT
jgi:lysyl-tRNA synthetase class 2